MLMIMRHSQGALIEGSSDMQIGSHVENASTDNVVHPY